MDAGGGSCGRGLAFGDEVVQSSMDAAFDDKVKEGAEAFEFQAEVRRYDTAAECVVVLTLTHRHYTKQSVVAGQAQLTLEWKKYLGSKTEAYTRT